MRIECAHAWVLHRYPFQNSSAIIDFFTEEKGRLTAVAKGCYRKTSRFRGLLRPFSPLMISASGRGDLLTLTQAELNGCAYPLASIAAACGFYLNELLRYCLMPFDAHGVLFQCYSQSLSQLAKANSKREYAISLRQFEKKLLIQLGYGLNLCKDQQGDGIQAEQYYRYQAEHGFMLMSAATANAIAGHCLIAFANDDYSSNATLAAAKYITQAAMQPLLGTRQLKTPSYLQTLLAVETQAQSG